MNKPIVQFIIIFFLLIPSINLAQNEYNIWYFGFGAGIDFNGNIPLPDTNSVIHTNEGCSSICDELGNLLFYTDGENVWNRNHQIMPNGFGLLGSNSSSQSALIIRKPGSNNIYYIFTTPATEINYLDGFRYSEVDMNLNSGLGDINFNKNILITDSIEEKITAVQHHNNRDIWVIIHKDYSNTFHSYLLSPSGLNPSPVLSHQGLITRRIGQLKSSPNGTKIAESNHLGSNQGTQVLNFDNSTGILSNPVYLPRNGAYGVEFSISGNVLYSSSSFLNSNVYQYDLTLNSEQVIDSSKIELNVSGHSGSLQLAPNGKIYLITLLHPNLSVIHNPDNIGTGCNFSPHSFYLNGRDGWIGLPNIFTGNYLSFSYDHLCFGDSTLFTFVSSQNVDSVLWNFGDPNSGANNVSADTHPIHIFTDTGSFNITLIRFTNAASDTITRTVYIDGPIGYVDLGNDKLVCNDHTLLDPDRSGGNLLWSDGSSDSTLHVFVDGQYWVQLSNSCGTVSDSINIQLELPVNLGNDTSLCNGTPMIIDATTSGATSYLWQDGSTDSTFTTTMPGIYWVQVTTTNCISSDTIEVAYTSPPVLELGIDTLLCHGESLILNASTPYGTYLWQDGSTDSIFDLSTQGNSWGSYHVDVTTPCGTFSDSIQILIESPIDLGNDTSLCNGTSFTINATIPGAISYLWQDGSTDSIFTTSVPGTFWVHVTSNNCISSDTIEVFYTTTPNIDIGNDTTLCSGESLTLNASSPHATYLWHNGSTDSIFDLSTQGNFWGTYRVDVTTPCGIFSDTIIINNFIPPSVFMEEDTFLCVGDSITLWPNIFGATSHMWQDGSTDFSFTVSEPGSYWVQATNECGNGSDTTNISFLSVNLGNDTTLCLGDTLNLNASFPGATYLWQDGSVNPTFTVSSLGTYWVQVTRSCGSVTDTIEVSYHPNVNVHLGNDTTLCSGVDLTLDASFSGASYLWQDGSTDSTLTTTGPGIYWVTVSTFCESTSDTIEIFNHVIPDIDLENDTTLCQGESLTLNATTSNASYLWQDNSTNPTFNVSAQGNYWVQVTTECFSVTDSIDVSYYPLLNLNLGNDTLLCPLETLALDASNPGASYLWQDNSTSSTFLVNVAGIYWVEVSDNCSSLSDTINITYEAPLAIDLGNDTNLCQGETLALNVVSPNASYLWQDNSTNSSFTVTQQGNYWVQVTDICNNVVVDSIDVDFNPVPNINLGNDTMLCPNLTHTADAITPGATYLWQDGSVNATYSISQTGTYWVTATNNCGTDADTVSITYHLPFDIDFVDDTVLCPNEVLVLDATTPNTTYLWSDFSTGPVFTITEAGSYWVEVRNICNALFEIINVSFEDCTNRILMPNVFSPNGDGDNDLFIPIKMEGIDQADISIFNRWGQKIHESTEVIPGWDGTTTSGNKAPTGTYYWIVNYTNTNNEKAVLKGTLTLLR